MNLFFDIETIPAEDEFKKVAVEITEKKLSRFEGQKKAGITKKGREEIYRQTAISGDFGRIFCVGYAFEDKAVEVISGDEKEILNRWWEIADGADCFIGHNIMDFDLRFIFKRSIVNGVKPVPKHLNLSFARYKSFPIFDTMREWEKWSSSYIALDTLAKILGLESSKDGGIDGSQVYDFYLAGKHREIYEYCKRDVEVVCKIWKRMNFVE